MLWSSDDILKATVGNLHGQPFTASGISIDSRSLEHGDLFIAIKGDKSDGHAYLDSAFDKGAAGAIVQTLSEKGPVIQVGDTLKAMEDLGRYARSRLDHKAKVIAITGSVGKTSVKEMMATAFSAQGKAHASRGSYNNHWGVPYTLAAMPQQTQYGIFEIGMNHGGEITPLTQMVRPDIAVITTIAEVHIENFKDIYGIADAKAEIFQGLGKDGIALLNADDGFFEYLSRKTAARIYCFGRSDKADGRLLSYELKNGLAHISAHILGEEISYTLQLYGEHMALNSVIALLAVKLCGGDLKPAAEALSRLSPLKGRGQRHHHKDMIILDESYNASPKAMKAALEVLGSYTHGRRIAILGDMYELGDRAKPLHIALKEDLAGNRIDAVITCGPMMRHLYDALPDKMRLAHFDDHIAAAQNIMPLLKAGDHIMIKGSRGGGDQPRMTYILDAILK